MERAETIRGESFSLAPYRLTSDDWLFDTQFGGQMGIFAGYAHEIDTGWDSV